MSRERDRDPRPDRPVFCGNFEYDAPERDILRLFEKYGPVTRIDMKTGFAFVYMREKRDGDDAIRKLDRMEYGYKRRPLRVEWAKHAEEDLRRDTKPSTTLFVVNFDARRVSERDVERHFDIYGRLVRVEIKKNYAFVQFEGQDSATKALNATNGSSLMGRQIAVEYVERDGAANGGGGRPREDDRGGRRDDRGGRGRSRSPYGRRASPPRRSPPRRGSPSPPRRRASPPSRRISRSPPPPRGRGSRSPPPPAARTRPMSRSPPPPSRRSRSPPPAAARSRPMSRSPPPPSRRSRSRSRSPVGRRSPSPRRGGSYDR